MKAKNPPPPHINVDLKYVLVDFTKPNMSVKYIYITGQWSNLVPI